MEPKIRFKCYSGDLVETTIKDLCEINPKSFLPDTFEYVDLESVVGTEMISHRTENKVGAPSRAQRLAKRGDIFYQTVRPYQKNNYLFDKDDTNFVFSTGYAQLRTKINNGYLFTLLQSSDFVNKVLLECTGTSYPAINPTNLSKIKVFIIENLQYQQCISSYFKHLDILIQSTTKKIESLKQVKSASLQSMFPQEGETKPRVRFKGFDDEWEKISLGKETYPAGIKNHDNLPLESYSISNEYGFIPQNVQFENGGTMATADKRMYYIVSKNSFGYNPARINVGSLGYYTGVNNVIVSSLYEIFKTSDRICDTFLLYWFKTSTFQKLIEQYQEGGVRFYFFYDKLCMCHALIPSYEEQQKIAYYFTNLDKQISLQTQRLEKLKQIKTACLDNMFV